MPRFRLTHCFRFIRLVIYAGLTAGLLWITLQPVRADEVVKQRPRVGLVLSGGGARGLAHVGVLRVLEDMHVPIDAIAGTSMGALVGGLYASGMTAAEIEKLVNSLDWQDTFRDSPSRTVFSFRRKQDDRNFLARYSLGVSAGGFELPMGLVQGQKQTQILRSATLPAADINDFDRLPTPFRAVATDLELGTQVVMSRGDLVSAMRASMSAPGIFTPVERDGRLLVDGGLVNNLPIDIAKQMNVDVLIVVDVSSPLAARDELTSPLYVTNQSAAIMIHNRTQEKRAELTAQDIVIVPNLGTMSPVEFSQASRARKAGAAAANAVRAALEKLALNDRDYLAYQSARAPMLNDTPRVDFITVDAASKRYAKAVDAVVGDLRGQPLDRSQVNQDLSSLYGLDLFESIDYSLVTRPTRTDDDQISNDPTSDEQTGLEFHLKPKSWGPNYVRIGLNLEDDFAGNSRYNLAGRFIMTDLNALGAEWVTDAQIGDQPKFATEFYQPLSWRPRWFVAPSVQYGTHSVPLLDDDREIAEYRVREASAQLAFGSELSNWGEVRVGVQNGFGSSRILIGDPSLPTERYHTGGYFARFSYDTLDSVYFPKQGAQMTLQWDAQRRALGADENGNKVSAEWLMANPMGRYTLVLGTNLGTNLSSQVETHDYFTLGGFLNLSGLPANSIAGPHYGLARAVLYRQIGKGGAGVLELPAYAGLSFEVGNVWDKRSDAISSSLRHDASLFFGADTPLGPLYLAAGIDDRHHSAFYLFLGRSF